MRGALLCLFAAFWVSGCTSLYNPGYEGPVTEHFNGEGFHNPWLKGTKSFGDFLKWQWQRQRTPWPQWLDARPGPPPPSVVANGEVRFTAINHATVLIQTDQMNILTDPIWSDRCSPWSWIGPKRVRPPGLSFDQLPPSTSYSSVIITMIIWICQL